MCVSWKTITINSTGESWMASIGMVADMVRLSKILDIFEGCWRNCGMCVTERLKNDPKVFSLNTWDNGAMLE